MSATKLSAALGAYPETHFERGEVHGMQIALAARAGAPGPDFVADVSAPPKRLVTGAGARRLLEAGGFDVPAGLLRWRPLDGDGAIACVHRQRYLLVAPCSGDFTGRVDAVTTGRHDDALVLSFDVADLALAGERADALMAEFCALDIADTDDDAWTATRFAHCEVMLRRVRHAIVRYRLMCIPADAGFLIETLAGAGLPLAGYNDYLACLKGEVSS